MSNLNPGDSPKSGGPVSAEQIADLAAASRVLVAQGVVDASAMSRCAILTRPSVT
jgi:hypothetical protein